MGKPKKNGKVAPELPPHAPTGAKMLRRYTDSLPVALAEDKAADLRTELVAATTQRVGKEAEVSYLREEIKGLKERESSIVGKLEAGSETSDDEVVQYLLPDNSVQAVRVDTGEIVESRTASAEDLQEGMFDENDEADAPGP
ncbi:MAG: hypothetical protein ACYDC2_03205 [Solirubrobacteraceae bacterium]